MEELIEIINQNKIIQILIKIHSLYEFIKYEKINDSLKRLNYNVNIIYIYEKKTFNLSSIESKNNNNKKNRNDNNNSNYNSHNNIKNNQKVNKNKNNQVKNHIKNNKETLNNNNNNNNNNNINLINELKFHQFFKSNEKNKLNELQSFHHSLLNSNVIILVNMNFILNSNSLNDDSTHFSDISQTIIYHIARQDVLTYCLHPSSILSSKNHSSLNKKTNDALKFCRYYLNNIEMIHLIGEPSEVLTLMTWSLQNFHHLSNEILLKSSSNQVNSELLTYEQCFCLEEDYDDDIISMNLSTIFLPLIEPIPLEENIETISTEKNLSKDILKSTTKENDDLSPTKDSTSPRRSRRKRKLTQHYSLDPNYSESTTKIFHIYNEDDDDDNDNDEEKYSTLREEKNEIKNDGSNETTSTKSRRKPLFPKNNQYLQLPPRHTINSSGSTAATTAIPTTTTKGIVSNQSYSLPNSLLSSPSNSIERTLSENGDSKGSFAGDDLAGFSQGSVNTLIDLANCFTYSTGSNTSTERKFQHIFSDNDQSFHLKNEFSNLSRTHSLTSQILDDTNTDSRETYRDDSYNGSLPLSQLSFVTNDEIESIAHIYQPDSYEECGDGHNLVRSQTVTSISSTSSKTNNQSSSLERKPSFLAPGTHYDGGGFQFMSGLSQ